MFKKTLFFIALFILCISLSTFSDEEKISLSLYLGDTINLKTYIREHSLDINLLDNTEFQNANSQVVEIDSNFNLKALSVGETIIVVVNNNDLKPLTIKVKSPIKSVNISTSDLTLLAGEIYSLNYELIPDDNYSGTFNSNLKWKSSKNNIAGVKGQNTLHTYGVGMTTLTATAYDKTTSVSINVKVIGNPNPLIIKPEIVDSSVKVGEQRQLKAFFSDKDVTSNVMWTSEHPDLLSIDDNGLVTPLKEGTCEITATSSISRKKDRYTFFIKSMVDSIHLDRSSVTLNKLGEQIQLNAALQAKNPKIKPLRNGYYFTSSNPNIASVDTNGLVTANSPGIALISAITYDSAKKDTCTIEIPKIPSPTSIDYTLTKDITLDPYPSKILIGQKILMNYKIIPENATDRNVKFHVKNGSDQIHFINGQYFFIPTKKGNTEIKIVAESGGDEPIEDSIDVSVVSPIASLDLDLDLKRGKKTERKLYIGEKTELLTEIFTQGHYSSVDVYPNTLEYTVDDPDILKLDYENGKYLLTAIKKGTTTIHVVNTEDKHDAYLRVDVLNPVKKIFTDTSVELPIGISYTPRLTFIPKSNLTENTLFDITSGINLTVEEFYFTKAYIDNEIAYEKQLVDYFKTLKYNSAVEATIARHKDRLNRLSALHKVSVNDYCLVTNSFLKDRHFNNYQYYTINQNKIMGNYPGKALVKLSIDNTASNTKTTLYWTNHPDVLRIQETSKWKDYTTLIAEHGLESVLSDLPISDKIDSIIFYLSNPSLFKNEPSPIKLFSTVRTLKLNQLPNSLFYDLEAPTTKQELAYIAMYLDNSNKSLSALQLNNIVYYDVINETVKNAIAMGYVTPISDNYFGVNENITYQEFRQTLSLIKPIDNLPTDLNVPLTHEQVLLLLSDLID
jgi:hypothetical protein